MHNILVLGGGFGGVTAARHLERLLGARDDVTITLVSRENYFVLTPLLFEACSGTLELRHCAQPIRPALRRARFVEATVEEVDVERRVVRATAAGGAMHEFPYDDLVVALGGTTNMSLIPGSAHALTFKSMADALVLRNHLIERFERADAAADPTDRRRCLTVVVIGGGLVGVELLGELTAFADEVLRYYPRIPRDDVRFHLYEAGPRILPELDAKLADVAVRVLRKRGAELRSGTPVRAIEPGRVLLADGPIDAGTVVLAAGIVPNGAALGIPVDHDARGRIAVEATMRSRSHPNVWALGDCAAITGPDGRPYPQLAQFATREAKQLARNVVAAIDGRAPMPFHFRSLGTMASLGGTRAVAQLMGVRLTGFPAWWFRRTYYLFQMPRWDRRLRMILDWTIALFFRPDVTRVDVAPLGSAATV
ncbi:Pyridine nucleotide-disulfide oxidoreductase, FAD/NAD(P)-binding domain protein (plasmid) [Gemmatirosa kalamazoonensis]|uniref:Pyridine nucleotide-disulfide oxidoreductase, FAD/NAD(P)-binding domain protein n=1 Tax=Gemmatirosa kalamazoonensis TaxID=861299 RepID=W0RSJ7_9BACT|nr:NAD(P)/FAD-dependent oxidoreductase [Gemmatirosa kalamazoonensis]AHG93442.1 Pyridine nucleotide-disulfide oxidoreductase, FAD/NAD(P)-binding domain protein [Gemmatirosa kalamazoonensis]